MRCPRTRAPSRLSATMSSTFGDAPCAGAANGIARLGRAWLGWPIAGCPCLGYPTRGRLSASASNTQGGSRMRESRTYGSVWGALSDGRPYRDPEGHFRYFRPTCREMPPKPRNDPLPRWLRIRERQTAPRRDGSTLGWPQVVPVRACPAHDGWAWASAARPSSAACFRLCRL